MLRVAGHFFVRMCPVRRNFGLTPIFQFACKDGLTESEKQMAKKAKKRKYSKGTGKKVKRAMKKRRAGTRLRAAAQARR